MVGSAFEKCSHSVENFPKTEINVFLVVRFAVVIVVRFAVVRF